MTIVVKYTSRYTLKILDGYLSGIPHLILNLKPLRVSDCFISKVTKSHSFGPT